MVIALAATLALQSWLPSAGAAQPMPPRPVIVAQPVARGELQKLVSPDDYPESALRAGEQGHVGFALQVGPNGRATGCIVVSSSGSSALDSATCRLMRSRARFTPARDSNGNPVAAQVLNQVSWALPAGTPARSAPPKAENWGYGMISNSLPPAPVMVMPGPAFEPEPSMAIPQDGPGPADLSVWTPGSKDIPTLGRYESIPICREAKAKLKLKPGQKAYCTLAPPNEPDLGIH